MSHFKNKRSVKNLILSPRLQLPFAFYSILSAIIFSSLCLYVFYIETTDSIKLILELTDVGDEAVEALKLTSLKSLKYILILTCLFVFSNVFVAARLSHKMVGPVVQFLKHTKSLQKGDFTSRVHLRPNDGFYDLANELNELAEVLEKTKARP